MCVRPILMMSSHSFDFAATASRNAVTAGMRRSFTFTAAAMHMAEGNESFDDCAILTWSLGCTGAWLPRGGAGELATAVGDDFVDVHVELGAAAGHPDVQRKHVVMLAGQNFIAGLNDQFAALIVKSFAIVVCNSGGFLQRGVGRDHFAWNEVLPDAEMFKRSLGLSAPELVGGHFDDTEAVSLVSHVGHGCLL